MFKQKPPASCGPAKVDAQFMAVALATYFTSENLASDVAADYGFHVTDTGIGTSIVNVGKSFFNALTDQQVQGLKFVVSDMWQNYLDVVAERCTQAVHVLDRFHIMANMNKALDQIRREGTRRLKEDGYEPILKHSRWCLLKRPENRTAKQTVKIAELLQYNLRTVRGLLHKEEFQRFWESTRPSCAGRFPDEWTARVMRSRLEPLKAVARSLREHRSLLLNGFHARNTISESSVASCEARVRCVSRLHDTHSASTWNVNRGTALPASVRQPAGSLVPAFGP